MLKTVVFTSGKLSFIRTASVLKFSTEVKNVKSTVDPDVINHFQKLTSSWWDEMGEMKPLHSMNKLRVPFIRDGLINKGVVKESYKGTPTPLKEMLILDVGSAGGILSEALSRLGGVVTGIDASSELVEHAKNHAIESNLGNLTYSCTSVEEHVNSNYEKYDAVVASEVLEHVNEKDIFLKACVQCLKPGGSIFITTINKTKISWFAGVIIAENILNLIPKNTHDWENFVAPHEVQRNLEDYNCRTKIVHGMCYNFLLNSWKWSSDTSINYALHAVKN